MVYRDGERQSYLNALKRARWAEAVVSTIIVGAACILFATLVAESVTRAFDAVSKACVH
jgi:ABC-type spermidine/putrescine transport system permease subunit II